MRSLSGNRLVVVTTTSLFDNTKYWDLGSGSYLKDGLASLYSGRSESTLIGFFGRLNYNWKDMLFASASLRYEGSSKFGANQKSGVLPSSFFGLGNDGDGLYEEYPESVDQFETACFFRNYRSFGF